MPVWRWKDYLDDRGRNVIADWIKDLPEAAQTKLESRLLILRGLERNHWNPQYVKPLVGYSGVLEIRFRSNRIQYRPLFCFGPGRRELTLLVGAIEKGDEFEPKGAPTTAQSRRGEIQANPNRVTDHE
jgi:hypothetical protein